MIVAGPALIALGLGLFRRSEANRRNARRTRGEIVESGTRHMTGGWQPAIRYRYNVGDREFTGTLIEPPPGRRMGSARWARRVARRYPVGTRTTVFYLRDQPEVAFLHDQREMIWLIPAVLGVALIALGIARLTGNA